VNREPNAGMSLAQRALPKFNDVRRYAQTVPARLVVPDGAADSPPTRMGTAQKQQPRKMGHAKIRDSKSSARRSLARRCCVSFIQTTWGWEVCRARVVRKRTECNVLGGHVYSVSLGRGRGGRWEGTGPGPVPTGAYCLFRRGRRLACSGGAGGAKKVKVS